jgi:hypothetical protein
MTNKVEEIKKAEEQTMEIIKEAELSIEIIKEKYLPDVEKMYDEAKGIDKLDVIRTISSLKAEVRSHKARIENLHNSLKMFKEQQELLETQTIPEA